MFYFSWEEGWWPALKLLVPLLLLWLSSLVAKSFVSVYGLLVYITFKELEGHRVAALSCIVEVTRRISTPSFH